MLITSLPVSDDKKVTVTVLTCIKSASAVYINGRLFSESVTGCDKVIDDLKGVFGPNLHVETYSVDLPHRFTGDQYIPWPETLNEIATYIKRPV